MTVDYCLSVCLSSKFYSFNHFTLNFQDGVSRLLIYICIYILLGYKMHHFMLSCFELNQLKLGLEGSFIYAHFRMSHTAINDDSVEKQFIGSAYVNKLLLVTIT